MDLAELVSHARRDALVHNRRQPPAWGAVQERLLRLQPNLRVRIVLRELIVQARPHRVTTVLPERFLRADPPSVSHVLREEYRRRARLSVPHALPDIILRQREGRVAFRLPKELL